MEKNIYNFDQSGIFIGASSADPSPLEDGVFLIPSNATDVEPPIVAEDQLARFIDGVWIIETIPQPTFQSPPTPEEVKARICGLIRSERDRRLQSGGYKVGEKWFHSDTFSRTQQMGLVMLGASIPENTPWKTMDGTFVTMTQALAGQIFAAAAVSDIAIFAAAETHKAIMEASDDPASYDFSAGWPESYYG